MHYRLRKSDYFFTLQKVRSYVLCRIGKLLLFVCISYIGLDDSYTLYILLYRLVHRIVLLEYAVEDRVYAFENYCKTYSQNRYKRKENKRYLMIDDKCHYQRKYEHYRTSYSYTHYHHICVLHVCNVRSHSRNKTGRGKFVNVGEGKILYLVIHILSQILGKSCRSRRRILARQHTEQQSECRHYNKYRAVNQDVFQSIVHFDYVYHLDHIIRYQTFHQHFERNKER